MQRPNRTHATPGISAGQAKAVQDKAKAMGFGRTAKHAEGGDKSNSEIADVDQKASPIEPAEAKSETGPKDGQSDSNAAS